MCDMEEFGRLQSSEKMVAIPGDRWWPQTAKQDRDYMSKQFLCSICKNRNEHPNVGGVSVRSRNGAPSRKGCVVNGQMTRASNKWVPPQKKTKIGADLHLRGDGYLPYYTFFHL